MTPETSQSSILSEISAGRVSLSFRLRGGMPKSPLMEQNMIESPTRAELVLRRYRTGGWLAIAVGVIVPFFAAAGAYRGLRLWRRGRATDGLPLLVVGTAVFVARLAVYAATGFHAAF
jgi:hypothetical protein